ncbi:zinc-ribbon domain-containing protein [Ottowia beijingensis]
MFKVVPDQLRISGGWVRCGHCNEVFDAAAHMLPVEAAAPAPPAPQSPSVPVPVREPDRRAAPPPTPAPDPAPAVVLLRLRHPRRCLPCPSGRRWSPSPLQRRSHRRRRRPGSTPGNRPRPGRRARPVLKKRGRARQNPRTDRGRALAAQGRRRGAGARHPSDSCPARGRSHGRSRAGAGRSLDRVGAANLARVDGARPC